MVLGRSRDEAHSCAMGQAAGKMSRIPSERKEQYVQEACHRQGHSTHQRASVRAESREPYGKPYIDKLRL